MADNFRSFPKIARRLKLTPLVARKVKNWPSFMYNYALGLTPRDGYVFRNGARIKIGRGVDHVPIIEIFLRQDYGEIPNNAIIVDLGANIGVFSIYATTTSSNATVYAYEPFQPFYDLMRDNVQLNSRSDDVHCFNYAVAGTPAMRELFTQGQNVFFPTLFAGESENGRHSVQVKCTTLQEIVDANRLDHIDLLKMDCEGAEYEILYQTSAKVFESIREIRMEYHNLDNQSRHVEALQNFLIQYGYTVTAVKATSSTNGNLWAERK